jgi:hypothetical protein
MPWKPQINAIRAKQVEKPDQMKSSLLKRLVLSGYEISAYRVETP